MSSVSRRPGDRGHLDGASAGVQRVRARFGKIRATLRPYDVTDRPTDELNSGTIVHGAALRCGRYMLCNYVYGKCSSYCTTEPRRLSATGHRTAPCARQSARRDEGYFIEYYSSTTVHTIAIKYPIINRGG